MILSNSIAFLFSSSSSLASSSSLSISFLTHDFSRTLYVLIFTWACELSTFAQVVFVFSLIQASLSFIYSAISLNRSFLTTITWFLILPSLTFYTISLAESSFTLCFSCPSVIRIITFRGSRVGFVALRFAFCVRRACGSFGCRTAVAYDLVGVSCVGAGVCVLSRARAFSILSSRTARISDSIVAVSEFFFYWSWSTSSLYEHIWSIGSIKVRTTFYGIASSAPLYCSSHASIVCRTRFAASWIEFPVAIFRIAPMELG